MARPFDHLAGGEGDGRGLGWRSYTAALRALVETLKEKK
jgi:heme oxygenase